ncbi:MAG: GNAT family N-acetyltransferase [Litoreibacter sp.]|nr:GNAT family N-acetyltransferase [Litoreibacter sp.]
MDVQIEICQSLPDRDGLNSLLSKYYQTIVTRMAQIGFEVPPEAPESALSEFWSNADGYLPPSGCLVVAQLPDGELVGCGMLKKLDPQTGELKRLFVKDKMRGTGTGKKLVEARERAAKEMGLTRLVADTLTSNIEMRNLYPKLGFRQVEDPIETTTYQDQPMLRPHLHYFEKDI